jgi:4-amino-4-deoxy-L-arabinose transferase-like glycosyltransferase
MSVARAPVRAGPRIGPGQRRRLAGGPSPTAHELWLLGAAIVIGLCVRLGYVLLTRHYALAGDAPEYDFEGWMIANGHWFYTRLPYGILHAGAWKAPGYPLWVGFWYTLIGHHPDALRAIQSLLGPITVTLTWVLGRRLFGVRVGLLAALAVALYPLAFQFEELLYPEALATPLTVVLLIVMLTGPPSRRRALLFGLLLGVTLLVRSSSIFLLLGALVAWAVAGGLWRGVRLTVLAAVIAALVITPWTIRNAIVMHGFLPVSMEDAAAYGTFNATAANDAAYPYAWLREPPSDRDLFDPRHPLPDITLHTRLVNRAVTYIEAHPASLPEAFFWNGIVRLWDLRPRSQSLVEVGFEGRSRLLTDLGLDAYDVLLPLALIGLWRARRRRSLLLGVLAVALGASIVFSVEAGTRYRAPLEPLIVVLAGAGVLGASAPVPGASDAPRPLVGSAQAAN